MGEGKTRMQRAFVTELRTQVKTMHSAIQCGLRPEGTRPRRHSETRQEEGRDGAEYGGRTRDIQLGKLALYQLS